ncbi:glycine cleavage Tprotein (aminomethyl transferase) domain containing protein [Acanthamoeba castellanii str. Neff]|uniref:Glycine cleavage Tprotein (Aminomethyl transferase) domain containing protein n=1 Tax=Acanthamoeba castellanii (strain ATCC 30010 / Neff) TaxID=1257118 RepID=L8H0R3_ACACF|nr:glycine cleavage Tprotein (aminomethyl transferase) domain containing protein [Acanthamoeba castellanii str. Neff]ELR18812.1 glycine cleavage Tprotein (aminomethyl transferase) domain containing protein [Acanthamoeba castellanii str. Neff]
MSRAGRLRAWYRSTEVVRGAVVGKRGIHHAAPLWLVAREAPPLEQPAPPPLGWWVGEVGGRAIVEVRGRDAARFLQGLTTNDLLAAAATSRAGREEGRYTAFLTPTGRLLADALVCQLPPGQQQQGQQEGEQTFLVECDARAAPGLVVHLRRYRLRAHVDITPPAQRPAADEWAVGAVLTRGHVQSSSSSSSSGGGSGEATPSPRDSLLQCLRSHAPSLPCFADPRTAAMGIRVYHRRSSSFAPPPGLAEASAKEYRLHRILHAVPEGIDELEPNVAVPLECNLDALNGVSYDKGCYLGQELTSRVHHTGVIRKRLMPVMCFSPEDEAREKELRVAERLLDFVHGRDQPSLERDHLLPSVLRELPSLATTNIASDKTELFLVGADGTPERRQVGRLCGGVEAGLAYHSRSHSLHNYCSFLSGQALVAATVPAAMTAT